MSKPLPASFRWVCSSWALTAWLPLGCGGDNGSSGETAGEGGACSAIIGACHEKDGGKKGDVHDCHSLAHDGVEAMCKAEQDRCVKLCQAAPPVGGGTSGGSATEGTAGDSGHDETAGTGHADTSSEPSGTGDTSHADTGHDATTGAGSTTGTSGATGEPQGTAVCKWLAEGCHDFDPGCHEIGHDGDASACIAALADCLPKCKTTSCVFLGTLCHDHDPTCHELGHDGNASACDDGLEACARVCDH